MEIKKITVIGSGVMGSGVAAHLANAGFSDIYLLDILQQIHYPFSTLCKHSRTSRL